MKVCWHVSLNQTGSQAFLWLIRDGSHIEEMTLAKRVEGAHEAQMTHKVKKNNCVGVVVVFSNVDASLLNLLKKNSSHEYDIQFLQ